MSITQTRFRFLTKSRLAAPQQDLPHPDQRCHVFVAGRLHHVLCLASGKVLDPNDRAIVIQVHEG